MCSFVCTHLDAHDHNIARRNAQYQTILSHLQFHSSDPLATVTQAHDSSHFFIMGDLNYRFSRLPSFGYPRETIADADLLELEKERGEMVQLDTLKRQQAEGKAFGGLREGDLTRFAPTYKTIAGQVYGYSQWVIRCLSQCRFVLMLVIASVYRATRTVYCSPPIPTQPTSSLPMHSHHHPTLRPPR